jgi:hypothetical protein
MAAYQFPDNKLQEISTLVSKITGDYIGLNQLYNPDETHSAAGEHAIQILKNLQDMQEELKKDRRELSINKLFSAIQKYTKEYQRIIQHSEDSNPLLSEVLNQAHAIVLDIYANQEFRVRLRQCMLSSQAKANNDLMFPIQATVEVNELINNTIKDLESKNQGRSIPVVKPAEKKTFFSKFFSSSSNKVMDSSQLQRIPQAELDRAILFLNDLANQMPTPGFARTHLGKSMKQAINDLTKYIDEPSKNVSPIIYNALNKLAAGLQDYLLYINDPQREVTSTVNKILLACINIEFDNFLYTEAGKHYLFVDSGSENESPFKEQLNSEELDNFRDVNLSGYNRLEVLLTLLTESQFEDLCEKIDDAFERNYDQSIEESTAMVISRNKGASP